ncbi:MAG: alpha/beta fold hydrolase [Verrucomicrobia bacterium]|nr:MAG: alpha/beta fold hydrolase [Verrucomicrobiota bacterium]
MKPALLMIGGWAHPAAALRPLAAAVTDFAEPQLLAAYEPLPKFDQPALLLGWSLGGLRALRAALAEPERWLGLVLVSSTPCFCSAPDWPHGVEPARVRAMKAALRKNPEAVLRQFFADVAAPAPLASATVEEQVRAALALGGAVLAKGLDELLNTDLRLPAAHATEPTLVLHGREDRIIPCAASEWLAEQFIFSRFVAIDHAGHDLPFNAFDVVGAEIKCFLETL